MTINELIKELQASVTNRNQTGDEPIKIKIAREEGAVFINPHEKVGVWTLYVGPKKEDIGIVLIVSEQEMDINE